MWLLEEILCAIGQPTHVLARDGAAKKWRGLINIHDLDCTKLHTHSRIFERVAVVRRRAINFCPYVLCGQDA